MFEFCKYTLIVWVIKKSIFIILDDLIGRYYVPSNSFFLQITFIANSYILYLYIY